MFSFIEVKSSQTLVSMLFRLRILLVVVIATFGLIACGGSSSSGDDGGGADGVTDPIGNGPTGADHSDNIPTTTSLASIDGLINDADQEYRLFYIDASRGRELAGEMQIGVPWLMAYDPLAKETEAIDKKYEGLGSTINAVSPLALHQADITPGGEVNNYRIASVTYFKNTDVDLGQGNILTTTDALMRVGVAADSKPQQVTSESGTKADLGFNTLRQIVAFNLKDAEKAEYVFRSNSETENKYGYVSLDADENTPVKYFGDGLRVQTPLFKTQDQDAGSTYGWLVADQSQDNCLALVKNADLESATCIPNANGTGNLRLEQDDDNPSGFISGAYSLNNGVVLALPNASTSETLQVTTTLWFYERGSDVDPGKLHLLKNSNGDSLHTTGLVMLGLDKMGMVVSKDGNTLYLAAGDGGIGALFGGGDDELADPSNIFDMESHAFLYQINTEPENIAWERVYHKGGKLLEGKSATLGGFLIDAGTHFIWEINEHLIAIAVDGKSEILLDGRKSSGSSLIRGAFLTPVGAVSPGGWFFYNREANHADYAVAVKKDGSKRVELKNCTWIGASTSGRANYAGGNFSSLEPSEVFMACNNKQIAAVDANNPEAGRVILGNLAEPAKSIEMGRAAPGPHRLIRVVYSDKRYEVIYVNTRAKDSLKHIMGSLANESEVGNLASFTAPVDGF